MKTLIELYDERIIENVLGPESFHPEHIVYLCPPEVTENETRRKNLKQFLQSRGLQAELEFLSTSLYKSDRILHQLRKVAAQNADCAMDVTGGSDAALFAAGMFCSESDIPVFTYSRKRNRFYNISNAPFADELPCMLSYNVEEFFRMAGGTMRKGRVDNATLGNYKNQIQPFFDLYLQHSREWTDFIIFMQRISQVQHGERIPLSVSGSYVQKGEHGSRITANPKLLKGLERIGFLKNLCVADGEKVTFEFADEQVRAWLRDVGSVLELFMYQACKDTGIFNDVVSSAIVDWDGTIGHESVSNEIDVVAARGVVPLFISCKACEVKTEALNELAILTDRFGGKGAKAVIATTEPCNAAARHRAAQLGIAVIDREELENGKAGARLRVIMKVDPELT